MDSAAIFALIEKGLTLLPILIDAGIAIDKRVEQLIALSKGGQNGTLTDVEVNKIRADFDSDLEDFNADI